MPLADRGPIRYPTVRQTTADDLDPAAITGRHTVHTRGC